MQTAPRKMVAMMIMVLQLVCGQKKRREDADADDGEGRMHRRQNETRRPVSYIHKLPIVRPWRLLLVVVVVVVVVPSTTLALRVLYKFSKAG